MVDDKCANGGGVVRLHLDDHGFSLPRIDQPPGSPNDALHTEPFCDATDDSVIGGLVRSLSFARRQICCSTPHLWGWIENRWRAEP